MAAETKKIKHRRNGSLRRPIQFITAGLIFALLYFGYVSLAAVMAAGMLIGIIFGKVFCRWMCPMGLIMEVMTSSAPGEEAQHLYQYHKLGCPIAWVSGLLNRLSLFTVKQDRQKECRSCGACDSACYISTLNEKFSLFKSDRKNPADSFSCSRCLKCAAACPTGYLNYGIRGTSVPRKKKEKAG